MSHDHSAGSRTDLRTILAELDADQLGWDGSAGRAAVDVIVRVCRTEAANWRRRAGDLGDVGVGPGWLALDEWMQGDRTVDPKPVLRLTIQRAYAAEAAAVELGTGDPVARPRGLAAEVKQRRPHRSEVDLSLRPADDHAGVRGPVDRPAWLQVTAVMLVAAGWSWPQPAGECLAAMAAETSTSRRRSAAALARHATGVPPATWSALSLLAAGSGPGCAPERAWPGVPAIHRIGGAAAVRGSAEVRRIIDAAVAGRAARSGRAWLRNGLREAS